MFFKITGSTTVYNSEQIVKATTTLGNDNYMTMTVHFADGTQLLFKAKAFSYYGYSNLMDVNFDRFLRILNGIESSNYRMVHEINSSNIVELD